MKPGPQNSYLIRRKGLSQPSFVTALFPLLLCKKTQSLAAPALLRLDRPDKAVNASVFPTSNVTKKVISRRSTRNLERTNRNRVLSSQGKRQGSKANKTITQTRNQKQLDEGIIAMPPFRQKGFRVRKLDEKYMKHPSPQMLSTHCKSMFELNDKFSQSLLKRAAPTEVLYLNSNSAAKNGIAVLNISNFHDSCQIWKNPTREKLSQQFKQTLQALSSQFSVILRSQQMGHKAERFLSELEEENIEILAWINVSKSHSISNKLYNLSEVLRIIGTLSKIWIFEETADASNDISKEMMLPIFEQLASVSMVLYKRSDRIELKRVNETLLEGLKRIDSKDLINFNRENLVVVDRKSKRKQFVNSEPNQQYVQYDVNSFKNKLIQYLKILKNEKKSSVPTSVNYLVGDLVKRNFSIFEHLVASGHDAEEAEQLPLMQQSQSKYQIQILSL